MEIVDIRPYLNIAEDDGSHDTIIESLYNLAKIIFTQNTRVIFSEETIEETFMNFYSDAIYPNSGPVSSITSITSYSTLEDTGTVITIYKLYNNVIYLNSETIAKFIEVEYTAGYSTIPTEIDQILIQICSFLWTYDDNKVMLSGSGEAILMPNDVIIPKHIRESMAIYRVGL